MRELTLRMLPRRYVRLNAAIYGGDTSFNGATAGVRALGLALESGQDNFHIYVPIIAQYDSHSKPIITTDKKVSKADWDVLQVLVQEVTVLRVVLSSDGEKTDILAKLTEVEGETGDGKDAVKTRFLWRKGGKGKDDRVEWWA